ncbi:MAG: ABC transporter substrate-binding protein [Desulfobacterales bacterium]|nr:ABC transporter substrate-binding protein [Desulfobacterales bacterium]
MNLIKKWLAYLLSAIAIITFSCGFAQSQDGLRLITEDYPALNYIEDGQLKGPSVDIVKEIQKKLDITTKIKVYPWARGYMMLEKEDNVALFSTARTVKRENLFKWVGPLSQSKFAFFAKKGSGIKLSNLNDAKKYKIGVQRGGVNEQFLKNEGFTHVQNVTNPVQNFHKLMMGRFDLWFAGFTAVRTICKKKNVSPGEIEALYVANSVKAYIAFSKSTSEEVIKSWQNAYDELYKDGTIHRIFSKYNLPHMVP